MVKSDLSIGKTINVASKFEISIGIYVVFFLTLLIYSNNIEATRITTDWYLWMHHTIDKVPDINDKKYLWQKKHLENQTGTDNSFKPVSINKNEIKKKYKTWK